MDRKEAALTDNAAGHGSRRDYAHLMNFKWVWFSFNINNPWRPRSIDPGGFIFRPAGYRKEARNQRIGRPVEQPSRQSMVLRQRQSVPLRVAAKINKLPRPTTEIGEDHPLAGEVVPGAASPNLGYQQMHVLIGHSPK